MLTKQHKFNILFQLNLSSPISETAVPRWKMSSDSSETFGIKKGVVIIIITRTLLRHDDVQQNYKKFVQKMSVMKIYKKKK